MEGDRKLICGVPHTHVRCVKCGGLSWTQTVKGGIPVGYNCNECGGLGFRGVVPRMRGDHVDLSGHWHDPKGLMESEV